MGRRRNRKKQSAGFIFPLPLASVLGLAAAISLTYLWLCGRCEAMGQQIKALEEQRAEVQKRITNEEYKWAQLKTPENIARLLQQFNIEMVWPDKDRVVRIKSEAARERPVHVVADTRSYVSGLRTMAHD